MKYKDLFIDFDDTLYDTHGNAVIALSETFEVFHLERFFTDPQVFYDAYWLANIDLWTRYSKGEITRDYLIVERFRLLTIARLRSGRRCLCAGSSRSNTNAVACPTVRR